MLHQSMYEHVCCFFKKLLKGEGYMIYIHNIHHSQSGELFALNKIEYKFIVKAVYGINE